jgi:exodeoxyribonuclease VII large subunit
MERKQHGEMQRLDYLARRLVHPADQLSRRRLGLDQLDQRLQRAARTRLTQEQLRIAQLNQHLVTPIHAIRRELQGLCALGTRVQRAAEAVLVQRQLNLARLSSSLAHLNPESVLARGYSIVQLANGAVVHDAALLNTGDQIGIRFQRGQARATIDSTTPD